MLLNAQKLLEKAQGGGWVTPQERRHVVAYLLATQPDLPNSELADLFRVKEATIRLDKKGIREKIARDLKDEDVGMVIADIIVNFRRQLRDIEFSKARAKVGTHQYVAHCKAALEMHLNITKMLQDLGWYPKHLGNLVKEEFIWKAEVSIDGSVATRAVNAYDSEGEPLKITNPVGPEKVLVESNNTLDFERTISRELSADIEPIKPSHEVEAGNSEVAAAASETV
jgi:hypothetical protein